MPAATFDNIFDQLAPTAIRDSTAVALIGGGKAYPIVL